jgi:hypothetical protein
MTNSKQQTAVDSIIEFMKNNQYFIGDDLYEFLKQAKEMEKVHIFNAYIEGSMSDDHYKNPKSEWFIKYFEQYYNEIYGDDKQ